MTVNLHSHTCMLTSSMPILLTWVFTNMFWCIVQQGFKKPCLFLCSQSGVNEYMILMCLQAHSDACLSTCLHALKWVSIHVYIIGEQDMFFPIKQHQQARLPMILWILSFVQNMDIYFMFVLPTCPVNHIQHNCGDLTLASQIFLSLSNW